MVYRWSVNVAQFSKRDDLAARLPKFGQRSHKVTDVFEPLRFQSVRDLLAMCGCRFELLGCVLSDPRDLFELIHGSGSCCLDFRERLVKPIGLVVGKPEIGI